jgi:hypothetical protein
MSIKFFFYTVYFQNRFTLYSCEGLINIQQSYTLTHTHINTQGIQENSAVHREDSSKVTLHRYNRTYLYPMLNRYQDNEVLRMRSSCGSTHCASCELCFIRAFVWSVLGLTAKSRRAAASAQCKLL